MAKQSQRRDARVIAVQFLYIWSINPTDNMERDLEEFFAAKDQPRDYYQFGEQLIHGTLEKLPEIDEQIRGLAENWDFARIAKIDLAILRLSIYEMLFRNDIPPVVSINEAIDLSKVFSNMDAKRFINGILDRLKEKLDRPSRTAKDK
jgi:N utilization substance protein B